MYQARYLLYIGKFKLSETIITQWIIMAIIIALAIWFTRGLSDVPTRKRQLFLESAINSLRGLVRQTMGDTFVDNAPWIISYIGTLLLFFILSNTVTLIGLRSPTTDLDTTVAWGLTTFFMIYVMGVKFQGVKYFGELLKPTPIMLPLNIIGELSRPVSLSFRPFGNILGGSIIMALLYQLLGFVSTLIPNVSIPFGQLIIPVPLHIYFDVFEGVLQAFIFIMLTMVFVGATAPEE